MIEQAYKLAVEMGANEDWAHPLSTGDAKLYNSPYIGHAFKLHSVIEGKNWGL